ncbi:hypothetical protein DRO31_02940 [Candidatus Bathyarchaeota archaeon]|nr:MAG: hypothetical protein DRO31_02940 [Candidatus Bathyarchaeota archaeon]
MPKEKIVVGPKGKRGAWRTLPSGRKIFIEEKYLKAVEDWREAYESDFRKWLKWSFGAYIPIAVGVFGMYKLTHNPKSLFYKMLTYEGLGTGTVMLWVGTFYFLRGVHRFLFKKPKKGVKRAAETTDPALVVIGTQELPNLKKNLFWRAVIIGTVATGLYLESNPEALDELKQITPVKLRISGFPEKELLQLNAGLEIARDALGAKSTVAEKLRELITKPEVKDLKVSKVKTMWLGRTMGLTTRDKADYAIVWGLTPSDNFVLGMFVRLQK